MPYKLFCLLPLSLGFVACSALDVFKPYSPASKVLPPGMQPVARALPEPWDDWESLSSLDRVSLGVTIMKPGETKKIILPSNPTTGYSWVVEGASSLKHVKLSSDRFVSNKDVKKFCGMPGTQVFLVEALSPGREKITLVYKRSWEKKTPLMTKVYLVEVR